MNKCMFTGRLTKDPEKTGSYKTKNGDEMPIVRISIAVDKGVRRSEEKNADFFDISAFGKQAETIMNYFKKGSIIEVVTRAENNNYEKDGQTVYNNRFVLEEFHFGLGGKSEGNKGNAEKEPPAQESFEAIEEDMPF